jgi:glycosyltransferase involved in cell wall biosynthesis
MSGEMISVVVPTFRRPAYLRRALESVVAQTHTALEVLVADDANQDEAAEVVASFGDPRLLYLPRAQNLGMFANIVDAMRRTTGRFIIKLDDDDFWHESICARLLAPLEEDQGLAVSFCDHWVVDRDCLLDHVASEAHSRAWGRDRLQPGIHRPFRHLAIEGTLPAQFATLFRRESIDWANLPEELGGIYDRWLTCLASRGGDGAFYVNERLAYYRVHDGMDSVVERTALARVKVRAYERLLADPSMEGVRPRVRELLAEYAADLALLLTKEPDGRESREMARYSWRLHPSPRGGLAVAASLLPLGAKRTLLGLREAIR